MQCPKCQTENPETKKFCSECGTKLSLICPHCQSEYRPGSKFCGDCGQSLIQQKEPKPSQLSQVDYSAPKSYTPKHLADKILTSRSAIEGERKIVTVMFTDVAGFTSLSEKLDPEDVHGIMDGCFKIMMDEIHRCEGTINQFTGDGVMALFGAPLAHEDHAVRACHAALSIQDRMAEYGKGITRTYGVDFKMRIGLNSGPVVVGSIGDDLRMDYTAQGDTSNLAARMESSAKPGSIWVTDHIYRQAKEFFEFEPLGPIQVKGKEKPVEAYRIIKPTEVKTRIAASKVKGLTRFIGREREMETLTRAFAKVKAGEGKVVGIVGEAGVGKSRLLLEFRNLLPKDDHLYFEGRCLHYGGSIPYLPILDVLRSFLDIWEGEEESIVRKKLNSRIIGLDENLKDTISPMQELLSLKVDDEIFCKFAPKQKKEKTFEAIRNLLIRGSQNQPLVLTIEDIHWIDKTSEEFINYMIGWLPRARILLLLLYRPEYTHQWGSKSFYRLIGVQQLPAETSAELIGAILNGDVVPELRDLILSRASGNPLFMEEMMHNLLDSGTIRKKDDKYILSDNAANFQVPDTIQGIIAARLDRLEESLKRIMQVAAVVGREFAFRILETILEMKEGLKSSLSNLQGLEFIYEKSLFPELEYIFKHALVQEVAYNSLLINRRKEIHEKIGKAIEELHLHRLEEFYEMLAYHYSKSDDQFKAYQYLKLSGQKSFGKDALLDCLRFYKEALKILIKLPPTFENKREQIDLIVSMRVPEARSGYSDDFLPLFQKAEALSAELKDDRNRLLIRRNIGHYYTYKGGNPKLGLEYLENCVEQSESIHDTEFAISNGYDLCALYFAISDLKNVSRIAPIVVKMIEDTQAKAEIKKETFKYSIIYGFWGFSMGLMGNVDQAEELFAKGLTFAGKFSNLSTVALLQVMYGNFLALKGDGYKAIGILKKAINYLEETQTALVNGFAHSYLGFAYSITGNHKASLEFTQKGLNINSKLRLSVFLSLCHYFYSFALLYFGDLNEAKFQADKALEYSIENNEVYVQGLSLILLGRILATTNPDQIALAETRILEGIILLENQAGLLSAAIGYLWLGEIYADSCHENDALLKLLKAETMFREMKMDYWLGKAREALSKIG